ncbi:MAG: 2-hydroxychromene-2-carboxylate isomerase [Alphaproteobacteria bacterium]|jgi:2-hydroxychromene-2-carboxylate isomerase|nr:2-hydroxychromene-2-carboxylate isomerase [Alphaproteobacteria bacterium]MDP6563697.1 2-hydroxychromene-2-carboxylate isomerase [Alphaproteobacteria bacterium]MDP6814551.1 2-hydroxychromene-2-carboxylate isomerase [Alphaproteobacteria bacterium]
MTDIEYFYSAHSAFAYLGSARFMEIARQAGRGIAHRPIDLGRVVAEVSSTPFGARSKSHRRYFFGREVDRWSEWRNAPVCGYTPTHHYNDMTLANGMLIAGLVQGINIDQLAHVMLEAHWRDDADLADRPTLVELGRTAGLDPEPLLDAALSADVQAIYLANTEDAITRSVFGSPTYVVDGDMFYGQDRLEMVERALQQPFAGAPSTD